MTDLVVYYSRTQQTEIVAQTISDELGAKLIEVKDQKNRDGSIMYMKAAVDAMRNADTDIKYDDVNLADYETIYIGGPVWASKPTPAVRKFIAENDFTDCNVITFATMMSSGDKPTLDIMNSEIKAKGGNILRSFAIATKDTDDKKLTLDALRK